MNRRNLVISLGGAASLWRWAPTAAAASARPAILGGAPTVKTAFPAWPRTDESDERALLRVLRSGIWNRVRGGQVEEFEAEFARLTGALHCIATANGTSALLAALAALDIGPGDEVIVPPYTFVATVNAVLALHALPIFVDSDPTTFQIDASRIEAAITSRTRAILPVHLGGNVADMDQILAVSRRRNIPVVEDACQAHLAEWRKRRVGSLGAAGCFSFQASKNLTSGEGGALITSDADLYERAWSFHNNGRRRLAQAPSFTYQVTGLNLRLTAFQGALLLSQLRRLEEQSRKREENATYLTRLLKEIPGISPAEEYAGCTRNAYHLYMFRYDAAPFAGLSRAQFLKALRAEGIPASAGYSPLNQEAFLLETLESRAYQTIYGRKLLQEWKERNHCPRNDLLCRQAVWFSQNMLLAPRTQMDAIADAIRKIQQHAAEVSRLEG